jgi:quercetin dioxygenase-like cupin family protein
MKRGGITTAGLLAASLASGAHAALDDSGPTKGTPAKSRVAIAQELPALDGRHLEATLVEVTYEPGGANTAHRHPCPVVGYVLDGALRMQVKGRPEKILRPGDTFYESPSDIHVVSANASTDAPARFLAYFVCDRKTPLSIPLENRDDADVR